MPEYISDELAFDTEDEKSLLRSLALFYSLAFCLVLEAGLCSQSECIFPFAYFIAWNAVSFFFWRGVGGGGGVDLRYISPSRFLSLISSYCVFLGFLWSS